MESHDASIVRLAQTARQRRIQVFKDVASGQWFATSASKPDTLHRVTALSCDCMGFVAHQRCTHHSALLAKLGWLPQVAEELPATVVCTFCKGSGRFWASGDFSDSECGCCSGRGWFYDVVTDRIATGTIVPFPVSTISLEAA
jgi:hypothetical protein